jgi:eukaryotic-like serine/threonine-protein kinase
MPPGMALSPGARVGPYEVTGLIGAGGMGEVYRAHDTNLKRTVAIKLLPEPLAGDPERLARFQREAEVLASLNHPNIAAVYGLERSGSRTALIMEFVDGLTLDERIRQQAIPPSEALVIAKQIAEALQAAHEQGIVHRDLKPANIKLRPDGTVKVLDFGLAKPMAPAEPTSAVETLSPTLTSPAMTRLGTILGTASYMSPEQVKGRAVDQRADIWAFGCVTYEMLTGHAAFTGESVADILVAILEHESDWTRLPARLPRRVSDLLRGCLQKDAEDRVQDFRAVCETIGQAMDAPKSGLAVRYVAAAAALVAAAIGMFGAWMLNREAGLRRVERALTEASQLAEKDDYGQALARLEEVERIVPNEPRLASLAARVSVVRSIDSDPAGAEVLIRAGAESQERWQRLGVTPIAAARLPRGVLRWKVQKAGFDTLETLILSQAIPERGRQIRLQAHGVIPPEMVAVPAAALPFGLVGYDRDRRVPLKEFFVDKYEVTNEAFKKFVDAGGYANQQYWKHQFLKNGHAVPWQQAVTEFRDRTGRPGPATWEVGTYPAGQETFPVGGVSWYEAAAYAEFAGKQLPTIYHWTRAATVAFAAFIVPFSNIDTAGAAPVGSHRGMTAPGAFDMAGNVREWCFNEMTPGSTRYILGGSWNDPAHSFIYPAARSPFDRSSTNGFRLVQYAGGPPDAGITGAIELPTRDFSAEKPAPAEIFDVYRELFAYDARPLDAAVQAVDRSTDRWVKETITFRAAYGDERVIAYLFLPVKRPPPYQAVVYFPGAGAMQQSTSDALPMAQFDFLMLSGRAVLFPVYQGTYERRTANQGSGWPDTTRAFQDWVIQWVNDVRRGVDYLETRPDIQASRLAFLGFSWGADVGTRVLALEPRFKSAVLVAGGFTSARMRPEVDPLHFAPRISMPVLMINGEHDFVSPMEAGQKPYFALLGTPLEHKRHRLFQGGHDIMGLQRNQVVKEILGWLDKYLGTPDEMRPSPR